MVRLTLHRAATAVLSVTAYGSAAGTGALMTLSTVGAITWSPILLTLLATTAVSSTIAAEVIEYPKKGPKHAR